MLQHHSAVKRDFQVTLHQHEGGCMSRTEDQNWLSVHFIKPLILIDWSLLCRYSKTPSRKMQKQHLGVTPPAASYCTSVWTCCSYYGRWKQQPLWWQKRMVKQPQAGWSRQLITETPSFGNRLKIIITLWLLSPSALVCCWRDRFGLTYCPVNLWKPSSDSSLFQPRSDDSEYDRNTEVAAQLCVVCASVCVCVLSSSSSCFTHCICGRMRK